MLNSRRATGLVSLAVLLSSLTACANSPTGSNLEKLLAADPRQETLVSRNPDDPIGSTEASVQLPDDFPSEIPRYPNAQLKEVRQTTNQGIGGGEFDKQAISSEPKLTRWVSSAPSNVVQSFYQKAFQDNNWSLSQPTAAQTGTIEARLNDLQVTVSIKPATAISTDASATPAPNQLATGQNPEVATEFDIQYVRNSATPDEPLAVAPQPGDPDFIGPVLSSEFTSQPEQKSEPETAMGELGVPFGDEGEKPLPRANTPDGSQSFTDLNKVPQELRRYIEDLAVLGVLPLESSNSKSNQPATTTQFDPSKTISRREYARWLVAANNAIHANSPANQIRGASETAQPAFQDVPRTDPDFPVIQGLAEAGLIPSPLSGNSTAVLFRPNAPLTREQMILWKVPIDTRQALPNASVDAVKETWSFQDTARIDPKALRAVLADFQNSEQANIRRVFGYTTLFQPKKPVTRAEAAAALWYFGSSGEGISAQEALQLKTQQSRPSATSEEPVPSSSTNEQGSGE